MHSKYNSVPSIPELFLFVALLYLISLNNANIAIKKLISNFTSKASIVFRDYPISLISILG